MYVGRAFIGVLDLFGLGCFVCFGFVGLRLCLIAWFVVFGVLRISRLHLFDWFCLFLLLFCFLAVCLFGLFVW